MKKLTHSGFERAQYLLLPVVLLIFVCMFTHLAYSQTFDDARFVARLAEYVELNNNYLPAAGRQQFEGKTTGLKDPDPYIRAESAKIVRNFAGRAGINDLLTALSAETDYFAKAGIYQATIELQYSCVTDKVGYIVDFLTKAARPANQFPDTTVAYILHEACNIGAKEALPYLSTMKTAFADNAFLVDCINDATVILTLYNRYPAATVYTNALANSKESICTWAMNALTKVNNASAQINCNSVLAKMFAAKTGGLFTLKEMMQQKEIMRSENLNACLESGVTAPDNWKITKCAPAAGVKYPVSEAASYARCMEVRNVGGTTTMTNTTVVFPGKQPKSVEYGIAYKMAYKPVVTQEEVISTKHPVITVNLYAAFADNVNNFRLVSSVIKNAPYRFSWETLSGQYQGAKSIYAAYLVVLLSGQGDMFFDDMYVRRGESDLVNSPPVITNITVTPPVALLTQSDTAFDSIELGAAVTDPDGDKKISVVWSSGTQGALGSGVTRYAQLTKPGEHIIQCEATDDYGASSIAMTKVFVVKPTVTVNVSPEAGMNDPVSGTVKVSASINGLDAYANLFVADVYCYVNGISLGVLHTAPYQFNLYTSRLANSMNVLQCIVKLRRNVKTTSPWGIYYSDKRCLYVNNDLTRLAPRIAAPANGSKIPAVLALSVAFDHTPYIMPDYCKYYVLQNTTNRRYELGTATTLPYRVSFATAALPKGSYTLYVVAYYKMYDGTYQTGQAATVTITK
ncbi:MAG: hypothetical protein NTU54_04570 [Candidatus Omnitrophica bacterium]|nr:hypothetical protein [Candidatus Omnitrophota bacterium]